MNRDESLAFAVKAVQDIVSFFEVNPAIESHIEGDIITISVASSDANSLLIGRNADTLRSFQTLISHMLHNQRAELTRVHLDIADYKKQRAEKVAQRAEEWIARVRETGEPYTARLNAADRRTVHQAAAAYSDIETHSEGEGRDRALIISRAA